MLEFIENIKNVNIATINDALILMLISITGVFAVLFFFYLFIKALQVVFPEKKTGDE